MPTTPSAARAGRTLLDLGDARGAVPHFEHALELAGDRGDVHYALALAYQRPGDDARAATHFAAHEKLGIVSVGVALPAEVAQLISVCRRPARRTRPRLALRGDYVGALALVDA